MVLIVVSSNVLHSLAMCMRAAFDGLSLFCTFDSNYFVY